MKKFEVLYLVLLLLAGIQPDCCAEGVGLFFDSLADSNCMSNPSYPVVSDLYLILQNCSCAGGVGGWECALEVPSSGTIASATFGGSAINVASPPEYMVGLGAPIPQAEIIVLATFNMVFTDSCEIYLHSLAKPSMPGAIGFVYADGGNLENLIETDYSYGGPFDPLVVVGDGSCCPLIGSGGGGELLGEIPGTPVEALNIFDRTIMSGNDVLGDGVAKTTEPSDWYDHTEAAYSGVVAGLETECVANERFKRNGVMKMEVDVNEVYWGPNLPRVDVFVEGVEIPGCIKYSPFLRFFQAGQVVVGSRVVFAGYFRNNRVWTNNNYFYLEDSKIKSRKSDIMDNVKSGSSRSSLGYLFSVSNLVVELYGETSGGGPEYVVNKILKSPGGIAIGDKLDLDPRSRSIVGRFSVRGGGRIVCFLGKTNTGAYRLVSLRHGVYGRNGKDIFGWAGIPVIWN